MAMIIIRQIITIRNVTCVQSAKSTKISAHLTDGKSSLRINCEFCKVDAKLYNMNISGRMEDKIKLIKETKSDSLHIV